MRKPFICALKVPLSPPKMVPFCPTTKMLITKGYELETMITHFDIDDFQVKTKECTLVSTSLTDNIRFSLRLNVIGATFKAEMLMFYQYQAYRVFSKFSAPTIAFLAF